MRWFFLFVFFLFSSVLYSNPVAVTENDPNSIVEGVSVITGDFYCEKQDVLIQGAEPIHIGRSYVSQKGKGFWDFLFYHQVYMDWGSKLVEVTEPSGAVLIYEGIRSEEALKEEARFEGTLYEESLKKEGGNSLTFTLKSSNIKGMVNTGRGFISGLSNIKNQRIHLSGDRKFLNVFCPDGTKRLYKTTDSKKIDDSHIFRKKPKILERSDLSFILVEEELANGNKILYEWPRKKDDSWMIKSCSHKKDVIYAWAKFYPKLREKHRSPWDYGLETSDGRHFEYFYFDYEGKNQLSKVASDEKPEETIHYLTYKGRKMVNAITWPCGRFVHYTYYLPGDYCNNIKIKEEDEVCFRVKEIVLPLQENGGEVVTHTFTYDFVNKKTTVSDAHGTPTIYYWNDDLHLTGIDQYFAKDVFSNSTRFIWGKNGSQEENYLLCKILFNQNRKAVQSIRFFYDRFGNVKEEKLYGDLTGSGVPFSLGSDGLPQEKGEVYSKRFSYSQDAKNFLLSREEDCGLKITYSYHKGLPLVQEENHYDKNILSWTKTYEYNAHNNLIKENTKDHRGNTCRSILIKLKGDKGSYPCMPEIIEEKAGDQPLKSTHLHYTIGGRIEKRAVFDSEGMFRYDLFTLYKKGLLEKEINAEGEVAYSEYDELNNKIIYRPFGGKLITSYGYDFANRLCWIVDSDGQNQKDYSYKYNHLNQKTESFDEYRNKTSFGYDSQGNLLKTAFANNGVVTRIYDSIGCEISKIDAKGYQTKISYNTYEKPTKIIYPDGSSELFRYDKAGNLKEHTDQEGLVTSYEYDSFGRMICKKTPHTHESFTYDSFNLTSKTDSEGYTTYYEYDLAGRKISEKLEDQVISYEYDSLGRPHKKTVEDLVLVQVYDNLDRVIEERKEDLSGNWLQKISYGYDRAGNQSSTIRYIDGQIAEELLEYDGFNRLVKKTDSLGFETNYFYECSPHRTTSVDSMGLQTIETFNSQKKLESLTKKSSQGKTLLLEQYYYDFSDNMHIKYAFFDDKFQKTFREYDSSNRVMTLIEAAESLDQKVTRYQYTPKGRLKTLRKPSGIVLSYQYDSLGHLKSLISSDASVEYSYKYDTKGRLLSCENEGIGGSVVRVLDAFGNVKKETFPSGLSVENSYDEQNRREELVLPDDSVVIYDYDALYLRRVSYKRSAHKYLNYDLAGNLLLEDSALQKGVASYHYDGLGRCISIQAPYFTHRLEGFDGVGNLLQANRQGENLAYTYDDLYQLTSEQDHTYVFDAGYNRLAKDGKALAVNLLNQTSELEYTIDGNPKFLNGKKLYFDALDRLSCVEDENRKIDYSYDALHRRISKKTYTGGPEKVLTQEVFYLYDGQNEIGAYDPLGNCLELRILGATSHAEIGASTVLELAGQTYVPFHDLQGNISAIVSQEGAVGEYSYTAFGEEKIACSINPWRFSSKRTDEETGLVYYGRRYYLPELGRWLTQDPLGYDAGPNLYAFVLNAPLTHFDLYGLLEESWFSSPRVQGAFQFFGGITEIGTAAAVTTASSGVASFLAWPLLAHGVDNACTGAYSLFTGRSRPAGTVAMLGKVGVPNSAAYTINDGLSLFANIAGAAVVQGARAITTGATKHLTTKNVGVAPKVEYQVVRNSKGPQQVFYNNARRPHIFRNAGGHVSPLTLSSENRFVNLFKDIAGDPKNLYSNDYLTNKAKESGINLFAKTYRSGKEAWVYVRNNEIQNAGINLEKKYIYK